MIQITIGKVDMPSSNRRFKKDFVKNKWIVVDTRNESVRYKGKFEDVVLACHNLNKNYYKSINYKS